MKNSNLGKINSFKRDIENLIFTFKDILDEYGLLLDSVSSQYVEFRSDRNQLTFQYDVNRSRTSRKLVDLILENENTKTRLVELLYYDENTPNLNKLILEAMMKKESIVELFRDLFNQYMKPHLVR